MTSEVTEVFRPKTGLVSRDWIRGPTLIPQEQALAGWTGTLVGLLLGGLIFACWSKVLGGIVIVVALLLAAVRIYAPAAGRAIDMALERFGRLAGRVIAVVTLVPLFVVGFTLARGWNRLSGHDPLQVRKSDDPTFWLPADSDRRKTRYVRSMFATERLGPQSTGRLWRWLSLGVAALVLAEVVLRVAGFGHPLLYLNDPQVGFMPAPGQSIRRYGGRVEINGFGMRAPEVSAEKPKDTLRILMLGDSTLYGGSYVDQSELYARILEDLLRKQLQGRRVEVLNMGVNAWGPYHELGYLEKYGTFGADIGIVCLPILDIYRDKAQLQPGGAFYLAGSPPALALSEFALYVKAYSLPMLQKWGLAPPAKMQARDPAQGDKGIEIYGQIVETLRQAGCEVFVEVLPSRLAATTDTVPDEEGRDVNRLRERVERAGGQVAFPSGLFAKSGPGSLSGLYRDECHLDVVGHRLYANYLKQRLLGASRVLSGVGSSSPSGSP